MIYELAATQYRLSGQLDIRTNSRIRRIHPSSRATQATITQPGLVCCSKQTRFEGLPIFFRLHQFEFYTRKLDSEEFRRYVFAWLDKVGPVCCQNIRSITFVSPFKSKHRIPMSQIHRRLSEQASVIYVQGGWSFDAQNTREEIEKFRARKVPMVGERTKIVDTDGELVLKWTQLTGRRWFASSLEGYRYKALAKAYLSDSIP